MGQGGDEMFVRCCVYIYVRVRILVGLQYPWIHDLQVSEFVAAEPMAPPGTSVLSSALVTPGSFLRLAEAMSDHWQHLRAAECQPEAFKGKFQFLAKKLPWISVPAGVLGRETPSLNNEG